MILVVDDDPDIRAFVCSIIEGLSYNVIEAENGHHALKVFKERKPIMVITDIIMPEMDGIQLIRKLNMLKAPPITVAMTSDLHGRANEFLDITRELGATAILQKPLTFEHVQKMVSTLYPTNDASTTDQYAAI